MSKCRQWGNTIVGCIIQFNGAKFCQNCVKKAVNNSKEASNEKIPKKRGM